MLKVIYKDKLYDVFDITEYYYVVYDLNKGCYVYLPKEDREVV